MSGPAGRPGSCRTFRGSRRPGHGRRCLHAEGSAGSELGYDRLRRQKDGDPDYTRKFIVSARLYVSGMAKDVKWDGRDGEHCDVQKTLRELVHECERMAVKEVT